MNSCRFLPVILGVWGLAAAAPVERSSTSNAVKLLSSSHSRVEMVVNSLAATSKLAVQEGDTTQHFSLEGEGLVYIPGWPVLPSVSRFVIVPADKGLELSARADEPRIIKADFPPTLCLDKDIFADESVGGQISTVLKVGGDGIFPASIAEMSDPVVIRGVRMVKVTTYPVRFDTHSNSFLIYDHIQAEVLFDNSPPVNPAFHANRIHRSREFLKFLDALAINSDLPGRDDPMFASPYVGHYLIVGHAQCMQYARPFIEWRRKSGYKVDQLSISADNALNEAAIRRLIQERYDAYLRQGIDPFDNILLLGDRTNHYTDPRPNWILDAYPSESVWPNGANHADFLYATLEGDDRYPDVAFSRFASGGQNLMELAVAKTLAYEATPFMGDTSWFRRGGALSQHWGNNPQSAWHPSIHTNTRWVEEVLKQVGYDDIVAYENFDWDHEGNEVGPVVADLFNAKSNMVLGRIQNNYWRWTLQGVNVNNVFPFYITASGHGEATLELVFRVGTAQQPKGAVATTSGWGDPPTAATSALFMEYIKAFLIERMSFGWSRNFAIIDIETIFPNIRCAFGATLYNHVKTDFDFYGDPGIMPWFGAPRLVQAHVPRSIGRDTRMIEISVSAGDGDEPVADAQVTFYDPGNMPGAPDEYLRYNDMFSMTTRTDEQGRASFIFPDGHSFEDGRSIFVTTTGDNIRPVFNEIRIAQSDFDPEISEYTLTESEGNGDDQINPGETFRLGLTVANNGNERLDSLVGAINSPVSWIEVVDDSIFFGAIDAGETREGNGRALFRISARCPDGLAHVDMKSELLIDLFLGNHSKHTGIQLDPRAPCFSFDGLERGNIVSRGENQVSPMIMNVGRIASDPLSATLLSRWMDIQVLHRPSSYDRIDVNQRGQITGDAFQIEVSDQVVPGTKYDLMLALSSQSGFRDTVSFAIQVEEPDANTPTGPDEYGYFCFDDTDEGWGETPSYNWIEINPDDNNSEFDGTALDFDEQSPSEIGEAIVLEIGFSTNFYGVSFDHITIASNGFIAMGSQPRIVNFQNWPMDKAIGGAVGMLSPLWDDLRFDPNSWIGTYLDEQNHRLIIEWYRMSPAVGEGEFTFQVILYDAEHYHTPDNNQPILFQYRAVSEQRNIRNGDSEWITNIPYASIGISSPFGNTGVNYVWNNSYPAASARLQNRRALQFASRRRKMAMGFLYGRVVNFVGAEPLTGARIFTDSGISTTANEEGFWSLYAPADVEFSLTASYEGFNDSTLTELSLHEGDTLEVNFALKNPQITISLDQFEAEVRHGQEFEIPFTISNNGSGLLRWSAEKRLAEESGSPWDSIGALHCGQRVDDSRIEGVVFAHDHFFVAGANGADPNWIYILDHRGEPVGGFAQIGASSYGMKDLTWDGEFIWGSGTSQIFGFDTEGNAIDTLPSPIDPGVGLTWDPERNLFWTCGVTTSIFGLDREGNVVVTMQRDNFRKYGLAYWKDDPDGMGLYLFARDVNSSRECVWKSNPDENRFVFIKFLEPPEGGSSAGADITDDFSPLHTTFICVSNTDVDLGGDRIDLYEIGENLRWMGLAVESGEIQSGEEAENVLILSGEELRPGEYEGRIVFEHNGTGGTLELPVTLSVTGENPTIRRLSLQQGWNMISLNIEPVVVDIPELLSRQVESGNLLIIKDGLGRFYEPEREFSNLGPWDTTQGYQVAVRRTGSFEVRGFSVDPDSRVPLVEGWNMISYYPRQAVAAEDALAGIREQLVIVKDGYGRFYLPRCEFSNMTLMAEGSGYQLKVTEAVDLVYDVGERFSAVTPPRVTEKDYSAVTGRAVTAEQSHFQTVEMTGSNMSVLLNLEFRDVNLEYEIGVFTAHGVCVGNSKFTTLNSKFQIGLPIWADDPTTAEVDGAVEGEALNFRLWDGTDETSVLPIWDGLYDRLSILSYKTDDIAIGEIKHEETKIPNEFGLAEPYPNPFNRMVSLKFSLQRVGDVNLSIYDLSGRLVERLVEGRKEAGEYRVVWDGSGVSTGIYLVRLQTGGMKKTQRMLLLK